MFNNDYLFKFLAPSGLMPSAPDALVNSIPKLRVNKLDLSGQKCRQALKPGKRTL